MLSTNRFSVFCFFFFSQSISKQVIGPGAQTFENSTNKLSYSVGEVAVGAFNDEEGSYQLGNGYYPSLNLFYLQKRESYNYI